MDSGSDTGRIAALEAECGRLRSLLREAGCDPDQAPAVAGGTAAQAADPGLARDVDGHCRRLLEDLPDVALLVTDPDGHVTVWSEGARRLFGWSLAEAREGAPDFFYTTEDRAAGIPADSRKTARERGRAVDDRAFVRSDAALLWAASDMIPLKNEAGTLQGYLTVLRDRTLQFETGQRLARVEDRLQLALNTSSMIGTWDWDIPNDRVFADEKFARLYSVDPVRAAAGERIAAFIDGIDPADRPWLSIRIQETIDSGADFSEEYRVKLPDGAIRWVLARGCCSYDENHKPMRFTGVVLDITERKVAEQRLAESEERSRLATEAADLGIWDFDPGNGLLTWDKRVRHLFGVSDDWAVSLAGFLGRIHPEDRDAVEAAIQGAFEPTGSGVFDAQYRTIGLEDGITRWLAAKGRARFEAGQVVRFIGTVRDISDAKRVEASLFAETRRLEIVNRTGRMLSAELDLAKLLQSATDAGITLAGATFGAFFHSQPQGGGEGFILDTLAASRGQAVSDVQIPDIGRLFASSFRGLGVVRLADIANFLQSAKAPLGFGMPPGPVGFRSALAVPVTSRSGQLLGTFLFGHPHPGVFEENDEKVIVGMAAQVAVAIDNARLYQAAQSEIAERKQVEAELRTAEASIRIAVKAAKLGRFDHRPSLGRRFWDRRTKQILGVDKDADFSFDDFLSLIQPADRDRVASAVAAALDPSGFGAFHAEYRIVVPGQGSIRWVEASGAAFFEKGRCIRFTGVIADVTERKRAEEHLRLMVNELNHRVKNSLAIVQAVALQTLRDKPSLAEARTSFTERLIALAKAHDVLTQENWEGADLGDVVDKAIATYLGEIHERIVLEGPRIRLSPKTALSMSMAMHELCTNAVKHGALCDGNGRVDVVWTIVETTSGPCLDFVWRESGGPPVSPPARKGFGSKLIERGLAAELGGEVGIDYAPGGVICTIHAPLASEDRKIE